MDKFVVRTRNLEKDLARNLKLRVYYSSNYDAAETGVSHILPIFEKWSDVFQITAVR